MTMTFFAIGILGLVLSRRITVGSVLGRSRSKGLLIYDDDSSPILLYGQGDGGVVL